MLFISGAAAHARNVFSQESRGYWSLALPLVLEKHGVLNLRTAGPEALAHPATWDQSAVVLIARLPDAYWTTELIERVWLANAGVIVEGPLPRLLARRLGVRTEVMAEREGVVLPVHPALRVIGDTYGHAPVGRVQMPRSRPVSRDPALEWRSVARDEIPDSLARAWAAPGWDAERFWVEDPAIERVAEWRSESDGERFPAIVRRGRVVGCNFGLFAFLGQRHTSEPFTGPEHRGAARSTGLEVLLLALIDELHAAVAEPRIRVLPWPEEIEWVRGVRHDFDRPIDATRVRAVLERHAAAGSRATWYWRARHAGLPALTTVRRDPRHEIALHTEKLWNGAERERAAVEAALRRRVRGSSAHGSRDCFGFQGALNLLWAERERLDYTEFIQHAHLHPHRWATLAQDGTISPGRVLCLPHHESLDRTSTPGDADVERIAATPGLWAPAHGFLQVMNHPDINLEELDTTLRGMPDDGRADWTAEQVATWWRRSHVAEELSVRTRHDSSIEVSSRLGVDGLVLERRLPDGTTSRHRVDLPAGDGTVIR